MLLPNKYTPALTLAGVTHPPFTRSSQPLSAYKDKRKIAALKRRFSNTISCYTIEAKKTSQHTCQERIFLKFDHFVKSEWILDCLSATCF